MKYLLACSLVLAMSAAVSAECDVVDYDGETVLWKISWDVEAGRMCVGARCQDVETIAGADGAYVGITSDGSGRLVVYFAPACWNKDDAGYVHNSGNRKPYFLKNCTLPRRVC